MASKVMDEKPVIETVNLCKHYGEFVALNDLTLTVSRGQILGLIGPNGAGKTTTIKMLVGLSRPTSGKAFIAGADCTQDVRRIKQLVGYMPDKFGSYENMRVREYLDFFGAAFGLKSGVRKKRISEVMEITDATYMQDRYVESLSHGMQQRVGIARTLLHDPEVLIFDEPANGLDPKARVEMRELLLRLSGMGKTLIVTSHILPELARICNQVAIISGGKLKAAGALTEIMKQVTQARLLEIQLNAASELESAEKVVREFAEEGAEVTTSNSERTVRIRTQRPEDQWNVLLEGLVGAKVQLSQFREIQTDLEDAYLSVTQSASQQDENRSTANV